MSNISTLLKTWGAQGSEYPDGYNYLEGEQPVDAWDNYFKYHAIENIQDLIDVANGRLESQSGAAHPASPEVGHLSHRTDAPAQAAHEELYYYDGTAGAFTRLLSADGDTMDGVLDMGGNAITDETGVVTIGDAAAVDGARLDHDWLSKQEGGTIAVDASVPLGTFNLAVDETLAVTQAMLTADGFTTAATDGLDLIIVADDGTTTTILAADGTTLYDDETGSPLASYTNTTTAAQTVMIAVDNGEYTIGSGNEETVYAGFIARVV